MKLFMRAKVDEQFKGSSIPRVQKMETQQLVSWFNVTVMTLGRSFDEWSYNDGPESEVSTAIRSLDEIWKELSSRKHG